MTAKNNKPKCAKRLCLAAALQRLQELPVRFSLFSLIVIVFFWPLPYQTPTVPWGALTWSFCSTASPRRATTGTRCMVDCDVPSCPASLRKATVTVVYLLQVWEPLAQRFHRVIALDFLGFGFSDKPVSGRTLGLTFRCTGRAYYFTLRVCARLFSAAAQVFHI